MIQDSDTLSSFLTGLEDSSYRLSYAKTLATQCLTSLAYEKLQSYQKRLTIDINECETIYDVNTILKSISSHSDSLDDSLSLFFDNEEDTFSEQVPKKEFEATIIPFKDQMDCTDRLLEELNDELNMEISILTETNENVENNVVSPSNRTASPACDGIPNQNNTIPLSSIQSRLMISVVDHTPVNERKRKSAKEFKVKEKKLKNPVGRPSKKSVVVLDNKI